MIYGIGTDLIRIGRIEQAMARHGARFAQRILGPEEFEKYQRRQAKVEARGLRFLATRFAAKEAFSKALGLGMRMPMTWRAVQILNDPSGRPVALVGGSLKDYMDQRHLKAQVSISDEDDYAVAFVMIEKVEDA